MEFDKNRVYTPVNADELKAGDKVIGAFTMESLRNNVLENRVSEEITQILPEDNVCRFEVKENPCNYCLAYLVERKENCTNCVHREGEGCKPNVSPVNCCPCYDREVKQSYIEPRAEKKCEDCTLDEICVEGKKIYKDAPCPYHRAKKHYRPFRDTDELIGTWTEKGGKWQKRELTMPFIWVRNKSDDRKVWLINEFDKRILDYLFTNCEFLDGSPCGVIA